MKQTTLIISTLVLISITAWSQENQVTLSGGYVFANVEDTDSEATGWRINGLYEFSPMDSKLVHGFSFGYISTTASESNRSQPIDYKITSWPLYYAPKFLFGSGSAKGFIKGAIGWQFSGITQTTSIIEIKGNDSGFYGGASVGFMKTVGEKLFFNIEYEWAYMGNGYYRDGFVNSAMLGIGLKF